MFGSENPPQAFIYDGIPNCYDATYVTTQLEWESNRNTDISYRVEGVHEALLRPNHNC